MLLIIIFNYRSDSYFFIFIKLFNLIIKWIIKGIIPFMDADWSIQHFRSAKTLYTLYFHPHKWVEMDVINLIYDENMFTLALLTIFKEIHA